MNGKSASSRQSLRNILTVRFVVLAAALVIFFGIAGYWAVIRSFREYACGQQRVRASVVAPVLGRYYEDRGSWDGVEEVLRSLSPGPGFGPRRGAGPVCWYDRLVVFDAAGNVVADTSPEYACPAAILDQAAPVLARGEIVGYVATAGTSRWMPALGELERATVVRITAVMVAGIAVSIAVAVFAARGISRRIASPFEALRDAALRVSRGDLGAEVRSVLEDAPEEVADLVSVFNFMLRELRASEEKRRAFLRDISHELRTPLTILKGNLEAIAMGAIRPDEETVRAMSTEVDRLERLARSLRDLDEALDASRMNPAPLCPKETVEHAIASVSGACQVKGITIEGHVEEGTGLLYADRDRLNQVLSNLLSNALRYAPRGGWIRVAVAPVPGGREARITVTDSGPGVPEEEAELVFQRFYRGDPSRARATGGSGLGLAIARAIVQAWGGRIWVERDKGGGAAFSFTVPLLEVSRDSRLQRDHQERDSGPSAGPEAQG